MLDYLKALDFEPKLDIREEFLPDENNAVTFNREENAYVVNTAFEDLSRRFFRPTALMNAARVIRERAQTENPALILFGKKTFPEKVLRGLEQVFLVKGTEVEVDAEIIARMIGCLHFCGGTDSEKRELLLMDAPRIMDTHGTDFFLCAMRY